jgi:hypothetical protein
MKKRRQLIISDAEVEKDKLESAEAEVEDFMTEEDLEFGFSDEEQDDLNLSDDDFDFELSDDESDEDDEADDNVKGNEEAGEDEKQPEREEVKFKFGDYTPSITKKVNKIPDAGVMSVVNSINGKRVSMSRDVHEQLGEPASVQIGFMKQGMVIGQYLDDTCTSYELRQQGAKHIIYRKELVEQITKHCKLDFTNRTSITFPEATYQKLNGQVIAIISMN